MTDQEKLIDAIAMLLPLAHIRMKQLLNQHPHGDTFLQRSHPNADGLPEGWALTDAYLVVKNALLAAGYTRDETPGVLNTWQPPE